MKREKMWPVWLKEYHVENLVGKCPPVESTDALKCVMQVAAFQITPLASSPALRPVMNALILAVLLATRGVHVQTLLAPLKRGQPASVDTEAPLCPALKILTTE
jgi:hypothetical protein